MPETVAPEMVEEVGLPPGLDVLDDQIGQDPEDDLPPADDVPAEEETPAEENEVQGAPAASVAHPPELLERAATLQIPADEVLAMTSDELRRVVKHADRVGQMVYNSVQQKPAETPAVAVPDDSLKFLDDPERFDPETAKFLKQQFAHVAKVNEESRLLRERLEKLEKVQQETRHQSVHSRLKSVAEKAIPEAAKLFDVSTPQGQKQYTSLLKAMDLATQLTPGLSEEKILRQAALFVLGEPAAEPLKAKKEAWDKAALAPKTGSRKTVDTAVEAVGKLLDSFRARTKTNGVR